MTSRGFDSIYRIAEAFARLMLKDTIDSEVVEEVFKFETDMYKKYGAEIAETPDDRTISYLEIAKVIKDHSVNVFWTGEYDNQLEELNELKDITFNATAEEARTKNERVRLYMGDNFRSSINKPARHLRDIFREERAYGEGRIKIVSKDKHAELKTKMGSE